MSPKIEGHLLDETFQTAVQAAAENLHSFPARSTFARVGNHLRGRCTKCHMTLEIEATAGSKGNFVATFYGESLRHHCFSEKEN
jgi:hypothetical protein